MLSNDMRTGGGAVWGYLIDGHWRGIFRSKYKRSWAYKKKKIPFFLSRWKRFVHNHQHQKKISLGDRRRRSICSSCFCLFISFHIIRVHTVCVSMLCNIQEARVIYRLMYSSSRQYLSYNIVQLFPFRQTKRKKWRTIESSSSSENRKWGGPVI